MSDFFKVLFSHVTLFVVSHDAIMYFVVFCICIDWIFSVEMINCLLHCHFASVPSVIIHMKELHVVLCLFNA